jgi:hypothetical protein
MSRQNVANRLKRGTERGNRRSWNGTLKRASANAAPLRMAVAVRREFPVGDSAAQCHSGSAGGLRWLLGGSFLADFRTRRPAD